MATYFTRIRRQAAALKADGCTGVPDFYRIACLRHDIHYRTHRTTRGKPITKEWADRHFSSAIRHLSALGDWSPMAWWRRRAVEKLGDKAWNHGNETVQPGNPGDTQ